MNESKSNDITSSADVRRIEQFPLEQMLPIRATYDVFVRSASQHGRKTALRFLETAEPGGPEISWTYSELLEGINKTANLLHHLGITSNDVISIMLPGCLEYHLALWGGEAAGIVNPVNPLLSESMMANLMESAGTKVLIAYGGEGDSDYWRKAVNLMDKVSTLVTILRVAPYGEDGALQSEELPEGILDFHQQISTQPGDRLISNRVIAPDEIAAYFHTGGTTGAPKIAKQTHYNQVFSAWAYSTMHNMRPTDCVIGGFPMFHAAGVLPGALSSMFAGVELIIPTTTLMRNRGVVKNYWDLSAYYRVTSMSGAPTILSTLTDVSLDGHDFSHLKGCRTGTAAIPSELSKRFEQIVKVPILESYGMTEMTGLSSVTPYGVNAPPGCAGITIPYGRYKLVAMDPEGNPQTREVRQGETGLILYKGPNTFAGYLDPEATKKTFTDDGWLITGDLGFIDEEEMLHVTGRAKDLIIRSGHNIDPKMIEDALSQHPDVVLSAAIGAPDEYAGELPVAFVTLKTNSLVTEAELLEFAARNVNEPPARPKSITILQEMPLTNVAKIFKPTLRLKAAEAAVRMRAQQIATDQDAKQDLSVAACLDQRGKIVVDVWVKGPISEQLKGTLEASLGKLPLTIKLQQH